MVEGPDTGAVTALPSGTVAFLFTDVEGSTQLLRKLRGDYAGQIDQHRRLVQGAFDAHGGRVVDSQGDSFFVVFARIRDAAASAAEAQRRLAAHTWPDGVEVRVRMGLHAGEAVIAEERYVGLGVHRAARISAAAHGGQVLLSQAAASLLVDDEPPDLSLRDLGEHRLRDFDRPERIFQLVIDGLPSDFPSLGAPRARKGSRGSLEFRILGPLEVVDEAGNPVPLGAPKQRALLAALLLRANEVVSTERLVDELWGEQPPKTATASLQNAVSALRKVLGADVLQTKAPGYVLSIDPEQVDLGSFEQLIRDARDRDPEERSAMLAEALGLWRGEPLAEFAFETFAGGEVRRLEELRLAALEDRIDADLEAGRASELVGELEGLVAKQPLRERLRGQLMLALYRAGRQADALNAYQAARRELVQELGIEPGPALQQLHAAILRQQRSLDAEPARAEEDDLADAAKALLAGRLVPVIGVEASELAGRLAERFEVPEDEGQELPRVAQWVAMMQGPGPLQDELRALLAAEAAPGPVHRFLASLPPLLRERGAPHQLIVTTGYDLALEQAFLEADEEFDVVAYVAGGRNQGKFFHVPPEGSARLIDVPNTYATELSLERRTAILKLHGGVDPDSGGEWESFVVTEDDYIDYIAQGDVGTAVPVALAATLRRSHLLFLGYGMREWNLRAILTRVWGGGAVAYRSWAVMPAPRPVEREFWRSRGVRLLEHSLEAYVDSLARYAGVTTETSA